MCRRFVKIIPYTVQLYLFGLFVGHVGLHFKDTPLYSTLGLTIAEMDPRLLLTLFLPVPLTPLCPYASGGLSPLREMGCPS